MPTKLPEQGSVAGGSDPGKPRDLTEDELAIIAQQGVGDMAPTMEPPASTAKTAKEEAISATVWQNDKRVTALWTMNQNRNSWAAIAGIGWKKFSTNSDSAILAMNLLAESARQTQTRVDYREEADGMIHEVYVW